MSNDEDYKETPARHFLACANCDADTFVRDSPVFHDGEDQMCDECGAILTVTLDEDEDDESNVSYNAHTTVVRTPLEEIQRLNAELAAKFAEVHTARMGASSMRASLFAAFGLPEDADPELVAQAFAKVGQDVLQVQLRVAFDGLVSALVKHKLETVTRERDELKLEQGQRDSLHVALAATLDLVPGSTRDVLIQRVKDLKERADNDEQWGGYGDDL